MSPMLSSIRLRSLRPLRPVHLARRSLITLRDDARLYFDDHPHPISWLWLRDACSCPLCVHPSTKQKLHRSSDIPADITPVAAIRIGEQTLDIQWPDHSHPSTYTLPWLRSHLNTTDIADQYNPISQGQVPVYWDAERLSQSSSLWFEYPVLQLDSRALLGATSQLLRFGIVFVSDIPISPTDNDAADLPIKKLAALFSNIRNTFYGQTWDVKSVPESRNIAYTNLNLDLHMDLLYFQDPPKFQVLHCLRNQVIGGTSVFVDAFERAYKLMTTDRDKFNILANHPIDFHYVNDGHFHHCAHPTIQLQPGSTQRPRIEHINYSPPFQAPFPLDTNLQLWQALRAFSDLLDEPSARFKHTLQEGQAVLFDNRRVLHARTAFEESSRSSRCRLETSRWLKGCYLEVDPLLDRARMSRI